jgi:hypothetical protein
MLAEAERTRSKARRRACATVGAIDGLARIIRIAAPQAYA